MKYQSLTKSPVLVLFALCALIIWSAQAIAGAATVQWLNNYAEAETKRVSQKKPGVLYFFNELARPAQQMRVQTLENEDVMKRLGNFVCLEIDQKSNEKLAKEYKVIKVPTIIFLDAAGRELDRAVGFKAPDSFVQYLDRITAAYAGGTTSGAVGSVPPTPFASATINISEASRTTEPITITHRAENVESVHIVGDFNDWRTDANPMTKGSDGTWEITIHLNEGVYEYLFLLPGDVYRPDPNRLERKPNEYGGVNSVLIVGKPKTSPVITGNSAFFMIYRPGAESVSVAGTFNNWEAFTMFRKADDPDMWGVRYDNMPPGTYQYKFIIDGVWTSDPENFTPLPDSTGVLNSSFVIK